MVSLRSELKDVKQKYAEMEFEKFCEAYERAEQEEPTGNPL